MFRSKVAISFRTLEKYVFLVTDLRVVSPRIGLLRIKHIIIQLHKELIVQTQRSQFLKPFIPIWLQI